jgi:hypothetical protein
VLPGQPQALNDLTLKGARAYSSIEMRTGAALVVVLLLGSASSAFAQESETEKKPREENEKKEAISFDFSAGYEAFSRDRDEALRFKNLFKRFGLAEFHVFPGWEVGPYLGPPARIWSNGFGTSLWRDPVTGWPLQ